jgi:hypothetical protein
VPKKSTFVSSSVLRTLDPELKMSLEDEWRRRGRQVEKNDDSELELVAGEL